MASEFPARDEFLSRYGDGLVLTASALVQNNRRYLLVLCPAYGLWRPPGGMVEPGEDPKDTVIREMKEELGIGVDNPVFVG
ncbi:NUDIX domain-containing protein [Candidatus Woesearchaeota archaeon]|nr:NUDIX domain-containing protein [Candidatus Woesearchaeota archaeon]